jgi:cation transport ATPase
MCVLMLACDHSITVEQVAKSLVNGEFKLGLKPKDKFNQVKH